MNAWEIRDIREGEFRHSAMRILVYLSRLLWHTGSIEYFSCLVSDLLLACLGWYAVKDGVM